MYNATFLINGIEKLDLPPDFNQVLIKQKASKSIFVFLLDLTPQFV